MKQTPSDFEEFDIKFRFFLPDVKYLLGLLKRNILFATVVSVITLAVVLALYVSYPNKYDAPVDVVYNPYDTYVDLGYRGDVRKVVQLDSLFNYCMSNTDFLADVAETLGMNYDPKASEHKGKFDFKDSFRNLMRKIGFKIEDLDREKFRMGVAMSLMSRLEASVNQESFTFSLNYTSLSPEESFDASSALMNAFIEKALRNELETTTKSVHTLADFLNNQRKKIGKTQLAAPGEKMQVAAVRSTDQKNELKKEEGRLIEDILHAKYQINSVKNVEDSKISSMRDELASLEQMYRDTHPKVKALKAELERASEHSEQEMETNRLAALRDELDSVHKNMKKLGMSISGETQASESLEPMEKFLDETYNKMLNLQLEKDYLEKQLSEPVLRTKFKYATTPKINNFPINLGKRKMIIIMGLMVNIMAIVVYAFGREFFSRYIRGKWIVFNKVRGDLHEDLPAKATLLKMLTVNDLDQLYFKLGKNAPLVEWENGIRQLESLIEILKYKDLLHSVFFISICTGVEIAYFLRNMATVLSCKYRKNVLIMDFDADHYAVYHLTCSSSLIDYFSGNATLNDIILRGDAVKQMKHLPVDEEPVPPAVFYEPRAQEISERAVPPHLPPPPIGPKGAPKPQGPVVATASPLSKGASRPHIDATAVREHADLDIILPPPPGSPPLRMSSTKLAEFFAECSRRYDVILVNGFNPVYFVENSLLLDHFKGCVLLPSLNDLEKSKFNSVLRQIAAEKINGCILLNS